MNGYCNQCDNHCAIDNLHCGRGYNAINQREDGRDGFRTLPRRPGDFPMEDHGRGFGGHARTLPITPGRDEYGRFEGRDCEGFGGRDFRGFGGPGGHRGPGGFGGPGGPGGMPPFRGRPPRPTPDADMLRERIADAGLAELIELSGRLMRHRPGAGSARGQNLVLSILAGRESISQRELQQMLGVQPGSISEIVSKLEKKGLVTREKAEDRRGNLLCITESGRQALPQAHAEPEDALFTALDEDQRDTLAGLLRTLLNDWAARLEDAPHALPERPPQGEWELLDADRPHGPRGVKV